ncbi:MAG: hypothetical protein C5B54_06355 [Acidobacteria bacterium]|nr:MAG: hypothetical protein C5B54_06355 [Acidobacteriota bacterium]
MIRLRQQLRIGAGFLPYLKYYLTPESAFDQLRRRVENREQRFLDVTKALIYSNKNSPYHQLLHNAGCSLEDLEKSVGTHGLERTLENLRDAGVYVTVDEFKSKIPIRRGKLTILSAPSDFDNTFLMGRSMNALTSGSTARATRVMYDWNFFAEEAANELLLHAIHGVMEMPEAFWYPGFPSISGVHNLLVHLKFRKPPQKWYSHLKASMSSRSFMTALFLSCKLFGLTVPFPETTELQDANRIAVWMSQKRPCCLKAFASSAVRVVQSAKKNGLDISKSVIFAGGEQLTLNRKEFIESAGVRVYPRYVATETGLVAAACNEGTSDSMHLYTDRLAAIQKKDSDKILFTTLSCNTGKVLLNTELGDAGRIRSRPCTCLFGKAGMNTFFEEIQNQDKLTIEGMTVLGSTMDAIVSKLVAEHGGGPDDYQFWESESENGVVKILIAVSPDIPNLNESTFCNEVLSRLRSEGVATNIASEVWKQAESLQLIRSQPKVSPGFKHFSFIKKS